MITRVTITHNWLRALRVPLFIHIASSTRSNEHNEQRPKYCSTVQIIRRSEYSEPKQPELPIHFPKWQPFLQLQRNLSLSSSRPYPLSKPARPPSSLLAQVATLGETTPNAAGPFWVTVSSALEMQRIHTSEASASWNTRRRLGWK